MKKAGWKMAFYSHVVRSRCFCSKLAPSPDCRQRLRTEQRGQTSDKMYDKISSPLTTRPGPTQAQTRIWIPEYPLGC